MPDAPTSPAAPLDAPVVVPERAPLSARQRLAWLLIGVVVIPAALIVGGGLWSLHAYGTLDPSVAPETLTFIGVEYHRAGPERTLAELRAVFPEVYVIEPTIGTLPILAPPPPARETVVVLHVGPDRYVEYGACCGG
ncbi:MAG TPA: hypothetical protein VF763_12635 [Candidatus Limnocylindrales bacterium]